MYKTNTNPFGLLGPRKLNRLILATTFLTIIAGLLTFFTFPTNQANAESISKKSDLKVDVGVVIALAVANCPAAPSLEDTTLTLTLTPVTTGTFKSDCVNVGVSTNAPGYSLLARANSDDTTNNLTYQGTTSITPRPNIPPTSASIASPATISPTHWGFAVENLLNFDTTYTANNASNKYSQMPITDTLMYKSNIFKTTTDIFKFFYGVNVASSTPAGTYLTTVTYTAVADDVPEVPQPFGWKQISAGWDHTCGIGNDNWVYCWGNNYYGQLGNNGGGMNCDWDNYPGNNEGQPCNSLEPVAILPGAMATDFPSGFIIKQLTAGSFHNCVIAGLANNNGSNKAYCWGDNNSVQLSNNDSIGYDYIEFLPVVVDLDLVSPMAGLAVKEISAGWYHTCAIAGIASDSSADWVYCWGNNSNGQLGDGTNVYESPLPITVDPGLASPMAGLIVKQLSAGTLTNCVIAGTYGTNNNDRAYCWGSNVFGQIGDDTRNPSEYLPVKVDSGSVSPMAGLTVKQISAGGGHVCAIAGASGTDSYDKAYCWGHNGYGQLGYGDDIWVAYLPVTVDPDLISPMAGLVVKQISTGGIEGEGVDSGFTCAIAGTSSTNTYDKAFCWGSNATGQLGNNETSDYYGPGEFFPVSVDPDSISPMAGLIIKQVSTGWRHACVIAIDNKAYCWGYNYTGQLGDGTDQDRLVPVKVVTSGL